MPLFFGLSFGLRVDLDLGAFGGNLLEDLYVHVLEALHRGAQFAERGHVLRQETVDLVKSQVTLLASEFDQTLESLPFVLPLHANWRPL